MATSEGSRRGQALRDIGAWAQLHLWEIQPIRDVLLIVAILLIVWLGYTASIVTVPLLLALLLAYLFEPLVRKVARGNVQRRKWVAGGIIVAGALAVLIPVSLLGVWIVSGAYSSILNIAEHVRTLDEIVEKGAPPDPELMESLPNSNWRWVAGKLTEPGVLEFAQSIDLQNFLTVENKQQIATKAASSGASAVSAFFAGAATAGAIGFMLFLTAFFFFFISVSYQRVLDAMRELIPDKKEDRVLYLVGRMDRVVAAFVRGRLIICGILGVLFSIGYTLIGAPSPILLGVATGVLSIAPYLALLALPVVVGLMFAEPAEGFRGQWWWSIGAPVGLYFLIQWADDYLLTPTIQGKQTDMDTPSILFATLAGAAIFGVYGLLIAIPLAACAKILWIEVVVPRIKAWKHGQASDPLPISTADSQ